MSIYSGIDADLQKAAVIINEELGNSFKHQDLSLLTNNVAKGNVNVVNGTAMPIETHILRKGQRVEDLGNPVDAFDFHQPVRDYLANPSSSNFDAMVSGRHYVDNMIYDATIARPKVISDRAFFEDWDNMVHAFNPNDQKVRGVHVNILNGKNKMWLNALLSSKTKHMRKDSRTGEPSVYEVDFPSERIITKSTEKTLDYKDLLTIRAMCQDMTNKNVYMLMNWYQQAEFKSANKSDLQNKDFVTSSDLRNLDSSLTFNGITPVIVEDAKDKDNNKIFSLDESQIVFFNPSAVSQVFWDDKSRFGTDAQANMQAIYLRALYTDFVRTDDTAVVIVNLDALAPSLSVGATSVSAAAASTTGKTVSVTTNANRIEKQRFWAKTTASWIHITKASGVGSGNVVFDVDANTGSARTGTVVVYTAGLSGQLISKTITVSQSAA